MAHSPRITALATGAVALSLIASGPASAKKGHWSKTKCDSALVKFNIKHHRLTPGDNKKRLANEKKLEKQHGCHFPGQH